MTDLKSILTVAAARKQQFGATAAQINYICALAEERDIEAGFENITTLTKAEASGIIDSILNPFDFAASAQEAEAAVEAAKADLAAATADYEAHEAAKNAWIAANYPDYGSFETKKRKRIRAAANKAVKI